VPQPLPQSTPYMVPQLPPQGTPTPMLVPPMIVPRPGRQLPDRLYRYVPKVEAGSQSSVTGVVECISSGIGRRVDQREGNRLVNGISESFHYTDALRASVPLERHVTPICIVSVSRRFVDE
jgi:hypothetical protein